MIVSWITSDTENSTKGEQSMKWSLAHQQHNGIQILHWSKGKNDEHKYMYIPMYRTTPCHYPHSSEAGIQHTATTQGSTTAHKNKYKYQIDNFPWKF